MPTTRVSLTPNHHPKCYDPNEETRLRKVISAVGEERFNVRIRALAKSCRTKIVPPAMTNPFNRGGTALKLSSDLLGAPVNQVQQVGVGLQRMMSNLNTSHNNSFKQNAAGPVNVPGTTKEPGFGAIKFQKSLGSMSPESGDSSRAIDEKGAAEESSKPALA